MFSNILLGAAGFPVADLGDEISRSLRFRGGISGSGNGGFLSKTITTSSTTAALTISFWVKLGNIPSGYNRMIFSSGTAGTASGNISYDMASSEAYIRFQDTSSYTAFTTQKLRDFSAWYHIVYRFDAANQYVKIYVNGSEHSSTSIATSARTSYGATSPMQIGRYADSGYPNNYWDGYLAEWNMLFGTSLGPDSFGRTNEDGVWVPKSLSDLTSNQYGALGNRLVFDSSAGLGDDTAPTGGTHASANDFTASGFDTADVALYSSMLFSDNTTSSTASDINFNSTSTSWSSNTPPTGFNGNTADFVQTNGTWIFRPTTPLANVTKVEVFCTNSSPNQQLFLNSANVGGSYTGSAYNTIYSGSATTINNIAGNFTGGGNGFSAIRINDSVLIDNTDNDVDYSDTPTSNYAVLNALNTKVSGTTSISNSNLRISATSTSGYIDAQSSIAASDHDCYCEVTIIAKDLIGIGVGDITSAIATGTGSYITWRESGDVIRYPGNTDIETIASYDVGDTIGMTITSTQVAFYKDGTLQGTYTHNLTGDFYALGMVYDNGADSTIDFNFGQMPFIHTVPTGFTALQTNNLPEPTIKNGKEHFGVVTFTNSTSGNTITGLDFQPDLVWIKVRNQAYSHRLADSVRGVQNYLMSNATSAEQTSQSDSLLSFTSDGFTTGAQGQANGDTNVAWCWKAGGTAVSNSDGSITSSVSANTDAGFSIVSYTGNETSGATVGHGLNEAPECILFKNRTSSSLNWLVYHKYNESSSGAADGHQRSLILNTNAAGASESSMLNNTAPGNSVITLGSAQGSNGSTTMIAYCWHSVEGFSKFGSYTGNNSTDGTFTYLGFNPSLLVIKRVTGGAGNWVFYDSTRSTSNPVQDRLYQSNTAESSVSTMQVDFLSNGFKQRNSDSYLNGSDTFVYMAFAENPFGGENAPPVTAR